ncbi:MAG: OmpA family protein [Chloroflexi bacterium]|nr:OmpA family protein [Chloroflexota bacterium]
MSHSGGGGGDERWLVSYADFITLLMVFFVIMYSMATIDSKKYKIVAESLRRAFGGEGAAIIDPSINQGSGGKGETAPAPVGVPEFPPRTPDAYDVATNLGQTLSSAGMASEVNVNNNAEGVLITISEQLLFQSGNADIQPSAKAVLDKLAVMLQGIPNDVRVVAHTDATSPKDARYPTNWHLTTARAVNIVQYLIVSGKIAPVRLTAAGQAEYHPLFPNDTPEHSAFNRRADIIIIYQLDHTNISVGVVQPVKIPGIPTTTKP